MNLTHPQGKGKKKERPGKHFVRRNVRAALAAKAEARESAATEEERRRHMSGGPPSPSKLFQGKGRDNMTTECLCTC